MAPCTRVAPAQHRSTIKQQRSLLSIRSRPRFLAQLPSALYSWVSGDFVLTGLGDGGGDRNELIAAFENMGIVMALIFGTLVGTYENAGARTTVVDINAPGLGAASFLLMQLNVYLSAELTCFCVAWPLLLHTIPTEQEATYFIETVRLELRAAMVRQAAGSNPARLTHPIAPTHV